MYWGEAGDFGGVVHTEARNAGDGFPGAGDGEEACQRDEGDNGAFHGGEFIQQVQGGKCEG